MKKILLVLFVLSALSSTAQTDSAFVQQMKAIWKQDLTGTKSFFLPDTNAIAGLRIMQLYQSECFNACHREFKTGTIFTALGFGIGLLGGFTESSGIYITGGVGVMIGGILMIDSHKWIGRAGRVHIRGTSIVYTL